MSKFLRLAIKNKNGANSICAIFVFNYLIIFSP